MPFDDHKLDGDEHSTNVSLANIGFFHVSIA